MEGKESALELLKDGVGMNFLQDGKKYRIFGSRCLLRNLGKVPAPFDSELSRTSRTWGKSIVFQDWNSPPGSCLRGRSRSRTSSCRSSPGGWTGSRSGRSTSTPFCRGVGTAAGCRRCPWCCAPVSAPPAQPPPWTPRRGRWWEAPWGPDPHLRWQDGCGRTHRSWSESPFERILDLILDEM